MIFYKETNFKETPIGKIPKEWEVERLGVLCEFKRGFSYRSSQITSKRTQVRFLTINDIEKEGGLKREAEKLYIKENVKIEPEFFINEGDVFIANTDMTKGFIIGAPILIKNMDEKYVYSMDLTKLIFNNTKIDSVFLFYYLTYMPMRKRMKSSAQGTNVLHLNHSIISNFFISLPPFLEQQKIAEVLSTVDKAIQKTDEVVAKTERLKKGLMQTLLTRGIGHKEFKDTEIGRIPKDWGVVKINKLFDLYKGTTPSTKIKDYWKGTIPFVTPTDITKINDSNEMYLKTTENYITEKGLESKGLKLVPKDSLLFTSRATIGCLVINKTEVVINQGIISLIPKDVNIDVTFFYYFLQKLKNLFENLAGGSTYKEISMSTFSNVIVPLPPYQEQKRIAEILLTFDKKLKIERNEKAKLERIKQGLMNLLLTGKIRIKVN